MFEMLGTLFVDLLLLLFVLVAGVAAFFMFLNARDAKVDEKLYDPEFDPDIAMRKSIHHGPTEDDAIDPALALKAFAQKPGDEP